MLRKEAKLCFGAKKISSFFSRLVCRWPSGVPRNMFYLMVKRSPLVGSERSESFGRKSARPSRILAIRSRWRRGTEQGLAAIRTPTKSQPGIRDRGMKDGLTRRLSVVMRPEFLPATKYGQTWARLRPRLSSMRKGQTLASLALSAGRR